MWNGVLEKLRVFKIFVVKKKRKKFFVKIFVLLRGID